MKEWKRKGSERRLPWVWLMIYLVGVTSLISGAASAKYVSAIDHLSSSARVARFDVKAKDIGIDYYNGNEIIRSSHIPSSEQNGIALYNGSVVTKREKVGNNYVGYDLTFGGVSEEYFRFEVENTSEVVCKYNVQMLNQIGAAEPTQCTNVWFALDNTYNGTNKVQQDKAAVYKNKTYLSEVSFTLKQGEKQYLFMKIEQMSQPGTTPSAAIWTQKVMMDLQVVQVD